MAEIVIDTFSRLINTKEILSKILRNQMINGIIKTEIVMVHMKT